MTTSSSDSNSQLVDKIKGSTLYQSYKEAFQVVSGLPLLLEPVHGNGQFVQQDNAPQNSFCQLLNQGSSCQACSKSRVCLLRGAKEHAHTCDCFAGLKEAAVPVKLGEETIAYLRTGQVRNAPAKATDFKKLAAELSAQGYDHDQIQALRTAYLKTKVISEDDLKQIVTLLAIFSLQLSNLVNQLVLAKDEEEPLVITKAKKYISERLMDRLSLDDVATAVGVSSFYFCKLFKQTTSMTFTEYVNRKRVECAKEALLKPQTRITEVAFEVGYQSLSQFNRSFLKYAGESPTQFRKRMKTSPSQGAGVVAC